MVKEVSAMFVDTTIFLPAGPPYFNGGGADSNIFCCIAEEREEYKGTTLTGPTLSPILATFFVIFQHASSISSSPVRNTSMNLNNYSNCCIKVVTFRLFSVKYFHRIKPPRNFHKWCIKISPKFFSLKSSTHYN